MKKLLLITLCAVSACALAQPERNELLPSIKQKMSILRKKFGIKDSTPYMFMNGGKVGVITYFQFICYINQGNEIEIKVFGDFGKYFRNLQQSLFDLCAALQEMGFTKITARTEIDKEELLTIYKNAGFEEFLCIKPNIVQLVKVL